MKRTNLINGFQKCICYISNFSYAERTHLTFPQGQALVSNSLLMYHHHPKDYSPVTYSMYAHPKFVHFSVPLFIRQIPSSIEIHFASRITLAITNTRVVRQKDDRTDVANPVGHGGGGGRLV